MVGSHKEAGYSEPQFSRWNSLEWDPIALKMSQSIAKDMAHIMNESDGDFQQGVCLYKPTSGIQWAPNTRGRLTGLRNKPQKKLTSQLVAVVLWQLVSLLIELSISDEKYSLPLCA